MNELSGNSSTTIYGQGIWVTESVRSVEAAPLSAVTRDQLQFDDVGVGEELQRLPGEIESAA